MDVPHRATPDEPGTAMPVNARTSSGIDDLLAANERYAASFDLRGIPGRAGKGLALVTCMDTRIEPLATLGLRPGDAKILRNAGGRVTPDVLRSLVLAAQFLDVSTIAVMQHTDCALGHRDNDDVRAELVENGVDDPTGWDFLAMPDPDAALAGDVEVVRTCALLPTGVRVEGWRYHVETGAIDRVVRS